MPSVAEFLEAEGLEKIRPVCSVERCFRPANGALINRGAAKPSYKIC